MLAIGSDYVIAWTFFIPSFRQPCDRFLLVSILLLCSLNHLFAADTPPNVKAVKEMLTSPEPRIIMLARTSRNLPERIIINPENGKVKMFCRNVGKVRHSTRRIPKRRTKWERCKHDLMDVHSFVCTFYEIRPLHASMQSLIRRVTNPLAVSRTV
jgi:hypothetical protein